MSASCKRLLSAKEQCLLKPKKLRLINTKNRSSNQKGSVSLPFLSPFAPLLPAHSTASLKATI